MAIEIKESHRGLLRQRLGVAQGKPIKNKLLQQALRSSDPSLRKQAQFAENAKSWRK